MNFNFQIHGLGKIDSLSLDVKPLTVIAGENSSGKTFATKSIYCVLEALNQNQMLGAVQQEATIFLGNIRQYESLLMPRLAKIDQEFLENLEQEFLLVTYQVIDCLTNLSLLEHSKLESLVYKQQSTILKIKENIVNYINKRQGVAKIKKHLSYIYKAKNILDNISTMLNNSEETTGSYIAKSLTDNFKRNYQVTKLSQLINSSHEQNAKIKIGKIGSLEFSNKDDIYFKFATTGIHEIQKINDVVFIDSPIYLRIRQGLQKTNFRIFRSKVDSRELKGYPEYIDHLYSYIDRKHMDEPEEEFLKLSEKLQEALSGKLIINKSGEINYHDEAGESTPLSLAATGVSNLGLIDLLIRNNIIEKGSFLIIDEPEAHIHPKWQVLLMEILYEMACLGVNVIIATHSLDMLKKLDLLAKQTENAEELISVHKMPYSKLQENSTIFEKIDEALTDLSTPYYEMYLEDNNLMD